jgi:SAM-dependent methyltransferase
MPKHPVDHTSEAWPTKVALRWATIDTLALDRPARVLDAFAGHGRLWRAVGRQVGALEVTGIDTNPRTRAALHVDNRRVLPSLDLAAFDVVDLDAYGVPADQAALVAAGGYRGPLVWTCAGVLLGKLPRVLIEAEGIPWEWEQLAPAAVAACRDGDELVRRWCGFLGRLGWARHVVVRPVLGPKLYGVSNPPSGWTRDAVMARYDAVAASS